MRKINQLNNSIHHGVANRDHRNDHAVGDAGDELLRQNIAPTHCHWSD